MPLITKYIKETTDKILEIAVNFEVCPKLHDIFKPFRMTKLDDIKVVFISNQPFKYSSGLAFGVTKINSTSLTVSDRLIRDFGEENFLDMPLGEPVDYQFDYSLESWAKQGVLLLNRSLTSEINTNNSHNEIWEPFLATLLKGLSTNRTGIIYVLIGEDVADLRKYIGGTFNYIYTIESPTLASKENREWKVTVFKEINNYLKRIYNEEIRWLK